MKVVIRNRSLVFFVTCVMLDLPVRKLSLLRKPEEVETSALGDRESSFDALPKKPMMSESRRPEYYQRWKTGTSQTT